MDFLKELITSILLWKYVLVCMSIFNSTFRSRVPHHIVHKNHVIFHGLSSNFGNHDVLLKLQEKRKLGVLHLHHDPHNAHDALPVILLQAAV